MKNIDILDLEYSSRGRDIDISEPILSYLEIKYGFQIERKCVFHDWRSDILKYRPKMIFIANGVGSYDHFMITKIASKLGIKVITHVSEGDYPKSEPHFMKFYWGWNTDRVKYEDLQLQWSQKNINLIEKYISEESNKNIKLSGATGFDKYKILEFKTREEILQKYKKNHYSKVIGIAGWGFDLYISDYYKKFKETIDNVFSQEQLYKIRKSKDLVKEILTETIQNNPDILFILKSHPLSLNKEHTEFWKLEDHENVLPIKDEENIYDIINICDSWGAYESTTVLESWLISNKPTFLLQPIEDDFSRSLISMGSVKVTSQIELNGFIQELFNSKNVNEFNSLETIRKDIIKQIIQWDDGLNHKRAAEFIYELYNTPQKKRKKLFHMIFSFTYFGKKGYSRVKKIIKKIIRRDVYHYSKFSEEEREYYHQLYLYSVKKFHHLNE